MTIVYHEPALQADRVIKRYPVALHTKDLTMVIPMPAAAHILEFAWDETTGEPALWVEVDPVSQLLPVRITLVSEGPVPALHSYVGTILRKQLVLHCYVTSGYDPRTAIKGEI